MCAFFLKLGFALVILALISLTFVFTYGYLLTSPYIRLEEVEVPGVDDDLKAQILELAQLNYDYSLLAVDLNGVKKRVQKHPWVRSVEVEKRFPHMLIIRVEKQKPLALALQGRLYYMNRWGELFKEVLSDERVDFPVVTGLSEQEKEREKQIKTAVQVLRLFESQAPPWDLDHLCEVHVKEDGTIHLYVSFMSGKIKVEAGELTAKLEELKKLVGHLASIGRLHMVKGINLDYHEGAAVAFSPN